MKTVLGIIGGSGLYEIDGLRNVERVAPSSPWGAASDALTVGELEGLPVVFLARHGQGHRYSPSEINYRTNIDSFKRAGVTDIISVSACGSLKEHLSPGTFVVVDQFIDRSCSRPASYFSNGLVAHVSIAKPTCGRLSELLAQALTEEHIPSHKGGIYVSIEGPQFSTFAESTLYRSWGCDVVGMTNMPEARLAREAEICYQTVAMVTDYDCWHESHGHVEMQSVLSVMQANSDRAKQLIKALARKLAVEKEPCSEGCDRALDSAIVTSPLAINAAVVEKLHPIIKRRFRL